GVTILTSLNEKQTLKYYKEKNVKILVKKFAKYAKENNLQGLVCSPLEIEIVRKEVGKKMILVVPGIRPEKNSLKNNDDHNKTFITIINKAKELSNFHAYFQTSISLTFNNETIFFKGVVRGKISSEPRGKYGFHYDPIFIPKGSEKTFGEMSIEEKNKISHRSRAINELKKFLIKSIN
ncbi:MAG: hypothetical protein HVK44_02495, partial [Pelagibacteraceae bacterium]|nr:hypothetical protein [Pelagibacteraceae bacterium]